jgi:hypothetical protein
MVCPRTLEEMRDGWIYRVSTTGRNIEKVTAEAVEAEAEGAIQTQNPYQHLAAAI